MPSDNLPLRSILFDRIRRDGPLTVAAFMELALYHPEHGYYARSVRRSGRAGDYYTSVDVGPLYGELLAVFVERLFGRLRPEAPVSTRLGLVEAGAGSGRLMRDVLDALLRRAPHCYASVEVALVECSRAAREVQLDVLGPHATKLSWSAAELPDRVVGLIFANELLDAMPVHRVRMTPDGLREIRVGADAGELVLCEGPPSTRELEAYFAGVGVRLAAGAVADVSLAAPAWVRAACRSLERGCLLLVDYGHEAAELFSPLHAEGTLRAYRAHLVDAAPRGAATPAWLTDPGERDLTAHVDFTAVRQAGLAEGVDQLAFADQTRFLLALGLAERLGGWIGRSIQDVRGRLAAMTLVAPGGLGSTHHALLLGRGVHDAGSLLRSPA